jgi:hypothetical protein
MSGLRPSVALDDLSSMRRLVAARGLVRRAPARMKKREKSVRTLRRIAPILLAALLPALPASAQDKLTERTFRLKPGATSPPATIADMAWLAGHWTGEALGGLSEEIWSEPGAGSMMGMYRLIKGGKPVFYELLTIVEQNGSLMLRLKHFNPDLTGWEEKQKTIDFPLVAKRDGAVHFDGMSFHPKGNDALVVYLAIHQKDGTVREEAFSYKRRGSR